MEITLEKIELVKDRTGVSYKVAKEALEAANGSVIDAIINIEEGAGIPESAEEAKVRSAIKDNELFSKIKETISKGNVSKILITKDGERILSLPLNVGVLGVIVAPWGVIFGAIAAAGFNCRIEFINEKGELVDINGKVKEQYAKAVQQGKEAVDKIKESDIFGDAVEKGSKLKDSTPTSFDELREKGQEAFEMLKGKGQEAYEAIKKTVDEFKKDDGEIFDVRVDETTLEDAAEEAEKTILKFDADSEQLNKVLSEVEKQTSWMKDDK